MMRFLSALFCLLAAVVHAGVLPSRESSETPTSAMDASALEARAGADPAYWIATMPKNGYAAFNSNPSAYKVWRNVMDYGAKGDGVTDDTDAINHAISDGNRCAPWVCQSSTTSPAVVYFPAGTYLIKNRIEMYYLTTLLGNPNGRAVIKADASLPGPMVLDSAPYSDQNGAPAWTSTNVFMRQIRNLIVDMTALPTNKLFYGIHWPASQATNLQNVKVIMTQSTSSQHTGIFVENGSGGWMVDIETSGGQYGLNIGNQQFTMRNIHVTNAVAGIYQIWNWGWLYQGVHIENCQTAFDMTGLDSTTHDQLVGSVTMIDSSATNCGTFLSMSWTQNTAPSGAGQVILENIDLTNVPVAVKGPSGTVLAGSTGSMNIAAWGQGHAYTPDGPTTFQKSIQAAPRPAGLLDPNGNGKYYSKEKPQYEALPQSTFLSIRSQGAKGDGTTDDTSAVQNAVNTAVAQNKILFFDHGVYKVTNTIYFPPGTRIVGEVYPVIMASGSVWSNSQSPVPVVKIGNAGESGNIEWSEMVVATQGPTPGAKLIEWNLASSTGSGLWDVHTRIGGAKGTNLQTPQCPVYSQNAACMAAFINVHVTKTATGAYFENNWFWTADHDLDDAINNSTQISVFTGRGLLVEAPNVWLYGNGVEHHGLYQYQFANTQNIFAGYIQTETPYWQPSPDAKSQPYPLIDAYNDPHYATFCPANTVCDALGLRILNSQNIRIYSAGFYSFFKNYDVSCSSATAPGGDRECQNRIFSIENSTSVQVYTLNEVGATQMVTIDGVDKAKWSDNLSVYSNTIGLLQYKV